MPMALQRYSSLRLLFRAGVMDTGTEETSGAIATATHSTTADITITTGAMVVAMVVAMADTEDIETITLT